MAGVVVPAVATEVKLMTADIETTLPMIIAEQIEVHMVVSLGDVAEVGMISWIWSGTVMTTVPGEGEIITMTVS